MGTPTYTEVNKTVTEWSEALGDESQNLVGRHGKPLRLYTVQGRPVTDCDGEPLRSITGRVLVTLSKSAGQLVDVAGYPLRDSNGRVASHPLFDPEKGTDADPCLGPLVHKTGSPRIIFDLYGFPLTDSKGRPLVDSSGKYLLTFDAKGEPACDSCGHLFIESSIHLNLKHVERFYESTSGYPLQIFDVFKRPLTSIEGFPLLDIIGEMLVLTDAQNNPIKTAYGSEIFDCEGRAPFHPDYNPTKKSPYWTQLPPVLDENGIATILFDQTGFPLTDDSGVPLIDSEGFPLFICDSERGIISKNGYDVIHLSASNYNPNFLRSVCNTAGKPARLFNYQGKPITNWLGELLKHADGCLMLKFDFRGLPKCDYQELPIYDEYGVPITEKNSSPFESTPLDGDIPRETDALKNGIKLFDASGMPVTDHRGFHLSNASRQLMIKRDTKNIPVSDYEGGPLFTENGLPLVKDFESPLLGPKGKACRLFDHKGYPLTNKNGVPLKLVNGDIMIKTDKIGRIIGDWQGGPVYDCMGVPMTFSYRFSPSKAPKKLSKSRVKTFASIKFNKQLFSRSGYPLTDNNGDILSTNKGKLLINLDHQNKCISDECGNAVFESAGCLYRPDKNFFRAFEAGSKLERRNYGDERVTSNHKKILKFSSVEYHTNVTSRCHSTDLILFGGRHKIFDQESFPLLDRSGAILQTSDKELVVKFDPEGKLVSDFRGYDVYDKAGIPLTNVTGFWRDRKGNPLRVFTQCGLPLSDSKGKPLHHSKGFCLLTRDEIGRPLLDCNKNPVFDANQVPSNDPKFSPYVQPQCEQLFPLLDLNEKPLRIYNSNGWPLNDENGFPLVNSRGENLIIFNNLGLESIGDYSGGSIFDLKGIPLGCKQDSPILTPCGEPYRLFSQGSRPLTDHAGIPLRFSCDLCMVVFDMFGRPFQDFEGGGLFDSQGNILGSDSFRPEVAPGPKKRITSSNDSAFCLFDSSGRPVTDRHGIILSTSRGEDLVMATSDKPVCSIDGSPVFDQLGKEFVSSPNVCIQHIKC